MAKTLKALAVTRAQKVLAVKTKLKALMAMRKKLKASVVKASVVQARSNA